MKCDRCDQQATIHVTEMSRDKDWYEKHLCGGCANRYFGFDTPTDSKAGDCNATDGQSEIQIEVDKIIISETHDQQVIMFREVYGCRQMPLVCGIFEVTQIDRILKRIPFSRPLTHDAWFSSMQALGAKVVAVCIRKYDAPNHTFFAELKLTQGAKDVVVDVRPSDALAISLKAGAPLFVAERLLNDLKAK